MKTTVFLTAILSLCLAGCAANAAKVTKAPATPAAPVQPPPLSTPQTRVELPEAQPLDLAGLKTEPAPTPPAAPAAPPPVRSATPPRRTPQPTREVSAPAVQPPAGPPPEAPRPAIQELIPLAEAKRLEDSALARRAEASRILQQLTGRRLTTSQQEVAASIRNFLALSVDAEKENDLRQADALAERAQILAKELQSGK
jgi:hypothetical protein